jgi:hypothetical protein
MNPPARLAHIVSELRLAGIPCLVMGGHAVRYYGLERFTNDFDLHDLHAAPDAWGDLADRLRTTDLFSRFCAGNTDKCGKPPTGLTKRRLSADAKFVVR